MIFTDKYNFGITQNIFLKEALIGYLNLNRARTRVGVTAGDATSIDNNLKLVIKKSYSEYLERFSMGIPIDKEEVTSVVNYIRRGIEKEKFSEFGYGLHSKGYNDTTGTAVGVVTSEIVEKAISELIEKNEVFCFWYGRAGKKLESTPFVEAVIDKLGFCSNEFFYFVVNEISNFPTIIVMGFLDGRLITTGVACCGNMKEGIYKAFQEAKIIEWQQYNNSKSNFLKYSKKEQKEFYNIIRRKNKVLESEIMSTEEKKRKLELEDWIEDIEIKLLYVDANLGIKVIKCISEDLLSALPVQKNILKSLNKKIVKKYYIDKEVECPIV